MPISVRGVGTYTQRPRWRKRILANLTSLPVYLLAPFTGVFFFNQSPVPSLKVGILWLGWAILIHWAQRRFFGMTLGDRVWGLRLFEGRGLMEKTAGNAFRLSAYLLLIVSLLFSGVMAREILFFHPLFQKAPYLEIAPFDPKSDRSAGWLELAFYSAIGSFPVELQNQPIWYELNYGKGPPSHFPPRVTIRFPQGTPRILLDAPRTPSALRNKRPEIERCLTSEQTVERFTLECLKIRRSLLHLHSNQMTRQYRSPRRWEVSWFQVDNGALPFEQRPRGLLLTSQDSHETHYRFVLISEAGQNQSFSLRVAAPSAGPEPSPELEILKKIIGSLALHPDMIKPVAWIDEKNARTNLAAIRGGGSLEKLGQAAALLISRATVEPGDPDTYFDLAGISLLILKKSLATATPDNIAALARSQTRSAARFMRDVAADDPRNTRLERMLLEISAF